MGITSDASPGNVLDLDEVNWLKWITNTVGELLSAAPCLTFSPSMERISGAISKCIDQIALGNLAKFAYLIQKPKTTVWGWQKGKNKMVLEDLLRVGHCLNIPALDFFTSESAFANAKISPYTVCKHIAKRPERLLNRKRFEAEKVEETLRKVHNEEYPPPAMQAVARRLGYNKRLLSKHFPDLCRAISARHLKHLKTCRIQEMNRRLDEVRQAVLKLYTNGIYPSRKRVAVLLTKPGDIERIEVYELLRTMRRELGLNYGLEKSRKGT